MRILQIHKDFEPFAGGGGTARHIHGLAKALSAKGCEVRVVSINPTLVNEPYVSMDGGNGELARQLAWADVAHVHGARSSYAFRGALRAYRHKIPFLYTPHAYYGGKSKLNQAFKWVWDRTAEKFLLEKGSRTILLTDAWYGFFSARGISVKKTSIIPNCVLAEDLAAPLASHEGAHISGSPAILTVGRLDPVKRVKDVIQALADPLLPQAHFHIVGRGAERASLEALASELGVADRVTFHGFVDDPGVAAMVAGSDVFVLASEQEGLPTVLLEMIFARLPVICTRIPGNLAITDVAGINTTYEGADIPALVALLAAAGSDTVSDASVANLQASFLWETRANDVLALYTAAVAARTKT